MHTRVARALVRSPRLLAAALALLVAGCWSPPPGIDDTDLSNVSLDDAWVYYREPDVSRDAAVRLVPEVADVRSQVATLLGVPAPRAELVIYQAPTPTATDALVLHTQCRFDRARGAIRFRYPLEDDALSRAQLLGTVGHEVAEASVLAALECLDPHVRWVHDGIADLMEHEVLVARDPASAATLLARARDFIEDRRSRGVEWIDLTRWRALAPFIVRSHLLVGPPNLSLSDLPGSRARVAAARARDGAPIAALDELDLVLRGCEASARQPLRPGEAAPEDPEVLDYPFYVASFAVWLEAERRAPGTTRRAIAELRARCAAGDRVLTRSEAEATLERIGGAPPRVARVPLERVAAALEVELRRLGR